MNIAYSNRVTFAAFALFAACHIAGCRADARPAKPGSGDGETPTRSCGGIAGSQCPPTAYCAYTPAQKCGAGDQMSVCKPKPENCTEELKTVCGCDGKDYGNECSAARAGVSVLKTGSCK